MKVFHHYINTRFRIRDSLAHRRWLTSVSEREGKRIERLDFIFADDDTVVSINREFLNHDFNTDVITFGYSEEGKISGEVYIGTETVRGNCKYYRVTLASEMRRVMVHALLHLCGYDDNDDIERARMRTLEEKYLRIFDDEFKI